MVVQAEVLSFAVLQDIQDSLQIINKQLNGNASNTSPQVEAVLQQLVTAGGKRLRPLFTLLAARYFQTDLTPAMPVAMAAEYIHMATLAHDDVIDKSALRRQRRTINDIWGNQVAVLAGDVLLARALVTLVETGHLDVVKIMAATVQSVCEGEIAQNVTAYCWDESEEDYFARIHNKTACFFAACCRVGALSVGANKLAVDALAEYGRLIGLAFQVIDDVLDICGDKGTIGKPTGSDLASGVLTLPVIYALKQPELNLMRSTLENGKPAGDIVDTILAVARTGGGVEYSRTVAETLVQQAKACLPVTEQFAIRECLLNIADMIVQRSF